MNSEEQDVELFSFREGLKSAPLPQADNLDAATRTRLWNALHRGLFRQVHDSDDFNRRIKIYDAGKDRFECIWDRFLEEDRRNFNEELLERKIELILRSGELARVFDAIEFCIWVSKESKFSRPFKAGAQIEPAINEVLTQKLVSWRLVRGQFIQNTNRLEVRTIERALMDETPHVSEQLSESIQELRNQRPADSIKKSISALETFLRSIGKKNGQDLRGNLLAAGETLPLHKAWSGAIEKIYAWTSDLPGVRHGEKPHSGQRQPSNADAMFSLVTCSAAINYLAHVRDESNAA